MQEKSEKMTDSKSRSQNAANEYSKNVAGARTRLETIRIFAESFLRHFGENRRKASNPATLLQKRRAKSRQSATSQRY